MGRRCSAGARKARVGPNRQSSLHLSNCRSSYCTEANKKCLSTKIIIQLWFAARSRRHRSLPTSHCPLSPFCRGQPPPPSSPPCLARQRPRRGRALDLPRAPRALGVVRCACAREGEGAQRTRLRRAQSKHAVAPRRVLCLPGPPLRDAHGGDFAGRHRHHQAAGRVGPAWPDRQRRHKVPPLAGDGDQARPLCDGGHAARHPHHGNAPQLRAATRAPRCLAVDGSLRPWSVGRTRDRSPSTTHPSSSLPEPCVAPNLS